MRLSTPFRSFLLGGFECSTQRRRDGRRLDLVAATNHDENALADYRQLREHGLLTVRDGVRWHLIEGQPGVFDWSSLDPMLEAARASDTQVIWDLLHFGWPDWTNPFDADFVGRFADFAEAVARRMGPGNAFVPVNEISFLAWGGGEVGYLNPFVTGRGEELKQALCKAAISATRRLRHIDPGVLIVAAEPLIAVHPCDGSVKAFEAAQAIERSQFDAINCLLGRRYPEFGGGPDILDVIGLNYYPQNQWYAAETPVPLPALARRPLRSLLAQAARHYGDLPLLIAETGCEDDGRGAWFDMILEEVMAANAAGGHVVGVCLYPILDHPGWDDDRHCRNGLLCGFSASPRPAHQPLVASLQRAALAA